MHYKKYSVHQGVHAFNSSCKLDTRSKKMQFTLLAHNILFCYFVRKGNARKVILSGSAHAAVREVFSQTFDLITFNEKTVRKI